MAKTATEKYGFSKSYRSFRELLDDPLINIVHISLPPNIFFEWATNALTAGKHVICEKPSTANADEARTLIDDAERRGLILQDAVGFLSALFYKTHLVTVTLLVSLAIPSSRSSVQGDCRFKEIRENHSY